METYFEELLRQESYKEPLYEIMVPENALILVPKASKEECDKLYSEWLKEFNIK